MSSVIYYFNLSVNRCHYNKINLLTIDISRFVTKLLVSDVNFQIKLRAMFIKDPCGIGCIIITYLAVFYADYVIIKWVILQTMQNR